MVFQPILTILFIEDQMWSLWRRSSWNGNASSDGWLDSSLEARWEVQSFRLGCGGWVGGDGLLLHIKRRQLRYFWHSIRMPQYICYLMSKSMWKLTFFGVIMHSVHQISDMFLQQQTRTSVEKNHVYSQIIFSCYFDMFIHGLFLWFYWYFTFFKRTGKFCIISGINSVKVFSVVFFFTVYYSVLQWYSMSLPWTIKTVRNYIHQSQ